MNSKSNDIFDEDTFIDYTSINVDDSEQKELEEKQIDCCVAYIDILGFKEMVMQDSHLPVLALRFIKKFINIFYNSNNEKYKNDDIDDDIIPKATMFSDSIVISQSINEVDFPLFIELIAELQYGLFVKGILIRGGISYGKLYHDENYLFGKGLINAYLFESKYADYPRILVDTDLINEIHKIDYQKFEQSWNDYIIIEGKSHYLKRVDNDEDDYSFYVNKDFDNHMFINYFFKIIEYGFMMFDSEKNLIELEKLRTEPELMNVKKIIETGLKTKDHRVLAKYEWLRKLYNSSIRCAFINRKIENAKNTLNSLLIQ